jgi:hypothetical protein
MKHFHTSFLALALGLTMIFASACGGNDTPPTPEDFRLTEIVIGDVSNQNVFADIDPTTFSAILSFSAPIDRNTVEANIRLRDSGNRDVNIVFEFPDDKTIIATSELAPFSTFQLVVFPGLRSQAGTNIFTGRTFTLSTGLDMSDKFPRIPDEELLDLVQRQTFRFFWEFGHPVSGMSRERSNWNDNIVATGATGFGVMAMIVAVERGFITHAQALERVQRIVTFLDTRATTYHGAFAHWLNGTTGASLPFSEFDDAADLVETSLLFQGLLAARQYFSADTPEETRLRDDITRMWEAIDWTWFQRGEQNVLYWHWSPRHEWRMNLRIEGWNESLITYVLAAASPTHPISKEVYVQGWARNGNMRNGREFYGVLLPLGQDFGGSLFFSQYSFVGIDPRGLSDQFADYWVQNRNHSLIHWHHAIANPNGFLGYGANNWGFTASDGDRGYSDHSPLNDRGVIAPTAALSSMPFTPEQSMNALHFFYYTLGDKLWSDFGFFDAFNLTAQWVSNSHIGISQGPIITMIENYRTGLMWDILMRCEDVRNGLRRLGFQSPHLTSP